MSELGPKEDLGTERDILRGKLNDNFGDLMCRTRSMTLSWVYIEVGCCLVMLESQGRERLVRGRLVPSTRDTTVGLLNHVDGDGSRGVVVLFLLL